MPKDLSDLPVGALDKTIRCRRVSSDEDLLDVKKERKHPGEFGS